MPALPPSRQTPRRAAGRTAVVDERQPFAVALIGLTAGLWAAGIGLTVVVACVMVGWATSAESSGSPGDALRAALQLWLVAHGTSVTLPAGGTLGLTPLGLTGFVAVLLWRAGRSVARYTLVRRRQVFEAAASVAVPYATLAALLATPAATVNARPEPWHALAGSLLVASLAAGAGMMRELGPPAHLLADRPRLSSQTVAAAWACAVLAGGAALLVVTTLVVHGERVVTLWRALSPGVSGSMFLLLACLALAPNAVVWAVAFALGPGFTLGTGTRVSPFGVELGALPAFPLLGGAPASVPPFAPVLLALPVAAGVVGGLVAERRTPSGSTREAMLTGATVGGMVGAAVTAFCWFASGPVGPGRLADVGAPPLMAGLAAAVEVGTVAALVAAGSARWRRR